MCYSLGRGWRQASLTCDLSGAMAARLSGLLLLMAAAATANNTEKKEDIHIAGFFPMTSGDGGGGNDEGALGRGVMHAVQLAVKHVNQARDILPNVKLHVTWNNTQVGGGPTRGTGICLRVHIHVIMRACEGGCWHFWWALSNFAY